MSEFNEAEDMAKYEAMRSELVAEGRLEPSERQVEPERTIAQPSHQEHHEPQQNYQHQGIPDVLEDPLSHFDTRTRQLEGYAQQQYIHTAIERDEQQAVEEVSDYWAACRHLEGARMRALEEQIPDGQQGDLYARSHGFRTAEEARIAHLNRDRQLVVQHAMQTGISPAAIYYNLAMQHGYRPTAVPKSLHQRVRQAKGGEDYDRAWDAYAKASRQADENYKHRR